VRRPFAYPVVILGLIVGLALGACGDEGGHGDGEAPVRAVATLEIFADMVRNVGGERVDVDALLPSGADPHTFDLAPNRVADIARADIVFMNGLALEESIEDVIANNAEGPVVRLSSGLPITERDPEAAVNVNPHAWLDVRLAALYVETIRDELIAIDPEGRATYEANATAYLERLGDLDRAMEETVASIPEANRKLVTFHDAFPYLAERYGLEVVAVVVPSPGQEPSAQAVADLVRTLESEGVPAVYKEPQFNAEVLDRAASEAGVRVLDLLSDAYIEGVDSYVGLMEFNIAQLREGLGGG